MNARDKAILSDLERFRCLSRDDIAELHFSHTKHPVTQANIVLKRLRREGVIKFSAERRKYIYFPAERAIKEDSQKINHFLAIADFYRQLNRIEAPRLFQVEPKLGGKGLPEPDVFTIWKGAPWFVEIQRTRYTEKVMAEKLNRYERYYIGGEWERASWQPAEKKIFPYVWIIGKGTYNIGVRPFRVFQIAVEEMLKKIK
ncbi:replication-relaxation family protein [Paenibacillus sp. FSL R5-0407]|uniref:replication-relaxation family protein n=1 Tax=Paenibacillus sp. FSL R5-0407 TaxID=2975320 RepID=UPI0030F73682